MLVSGKTPVAKREVARQVATESAISERQLNALPPESTHRLHA